MSFARLHKIVTYLIAALGLVALGIGSELGPESEVPIAIAFVASWSFEGARIHDPRWSRGWTVGLLALLAVQLARGLLGGPVLVLILEFIAALQISRLFNRRGAREHQQIGALALLQLIAATVLSSDLAYAFTFFGFVVVTPWTLALSHLRAEIERQRGEDDRGQQAVDRVLGSRRLIGPRYLAGTAALAVPLFVGTALLFLLFPRVGLGVFSFGRDAGQQVSGFGSNVELGDFGVIRTDPTVVLRVTPPDLGPSPPAQRAIRMRGTSFDHYDGARWTRSRALGATAVTRYDDFYAVPERLAYPNRDQPWAVVLDALEEPVIFFPPDAVSLQIQPRIRDAVDVGRDVFMAPGLDVRYSDADGLGLRYTAWTSAYRRRPAEALDPTLARHYLQVPDGHERVAALARDWTEGAPDDAARMAMIVERLRDGDEFSYSLEMPRLEGRLPLDVFLFEARRGHCEYYATALALMLRTLGIPSRNVTGFLGGRLNAYGGYYALSQGDAHSWVEAWLPGRGWVVVDPTPAARDEMAPDGGWTSALRDLLDALDTRWSQDVVAFDMRRQIELLRELRVAFADRPSERSRPDRPRPEAAAGSSSSKPWLVAAAVALALALAALWLRRRRRPAEDPAAAAAVEVYRALDAALARAGHGRPPHRTPSEHLAALVEARFEGVETAREVTERYLRARYGAEPLDPAERARLLTAIRSLRRGAKDLFASRG